ncbi:MAG TPA: DUF4340 domain-containing protein, partial [Polyangiaceae bacterium]
SRAEGEIAEQTAVDKLLSALEFATPERRLEPNQDRHALGLDAPRLRLTLTMGTIAYRVAIGAEAPSPPGAVYALATGEGIDGDQLVVLPRDFFTEIARPRDVYRGRTLIPYLASSLSGIAVETSDETRQLARAPWGGFTVVRGGQAVRVDRDLSDRLLTAFADLRAESFVADTEGAKSLSAAADKLRLTLTPSDHATPRAVLEIGGTCGSNEEQTVAVRLEPPPRATACVPKGVIAALSPSVAALADLHLFSLRIDEMEQIELTAGDRRLELVRSGTGWHMRAPTDSPVETDVGQAFARSLHDLTCPEIAAIGADQAGIGAGRAIVTRAGPEGEGDAGANGAREELQIGREESGSVYVRRAMDGVVLRCPADVARQLSPNGPSLRSRKVVDVPASHVQKIAITAPALHEVISRSGSGAWFLDDPKSFTVDPGIAADVAEALTELRADRWVDGDDAARYGLDAPRATYELVMEAGNIRIDVGRITERGSFARRADEPGVFVLPLATEQKIETWAIDRSYFMVDPGEVQQIRLEGGASSLTLGGAGDQGARAAEQLEIAKRALAEAHAEGVVHLGPARTEEGFDKPRLTIAVTRSTSSGTATMRMLVGQGDVFHETSVFYVRRDGIDATFAIAQGKLRPLLEMGGLVEPPRAPR